MLFSFQYLYNTTCNMANQSSVMTPYPTFDDVIYLLTQPQNMIEAMNTTFKRLNGNDKCVKSNCRVNSSKNLDILINYFHNTGRKCEVLNNVIFKEQHAHIYLYHQNDSITIFCIRLIYKLLQNCRRIYVFVIVGTLEQVSQSDCKCMEAVIYVRLSNVGHRVSRNGYTLRAKQSSHPSCHLCDGWSVLSAFASVCLLCTKENNSFSSSK